MTDIIVYGRGKTGLALANLAKKLGLPPVFYDDEKGFDGNEKFSHGSVVVKSWRQTLCKGHCRGAEGRSENSWRVGFLLSAV